MAQPEYRAYEAEGNLAGAMTSYEAALAIDRSDENPSSVLSDLQAISRLSIRMGDNARAAAVLLRCARIERNLGVLDAAETDLTQADGLCVKAACGALEAELRDERSALAQARKDHGKTSAKDRSGQQEGSDVVSR